MSAAPGATNYSIHAGGYQNALTLYGGTKTVNGVTYSTNNPGAGAIYAPGAGTNGGAGSASASASAGAPGTAAAATAAPIARTPTPQETANTKYMPQLDAQMAKDPSNGYADQLKTLMTGQFSPNDPSYAWRFQQGQQAVERSAAARGLLQSGNAAIELQQYGQGMASQEYGAQFNRTLSAMGASESAFQASYNRLAELAGMTTGMQANSQNTNYNYLNLAERAQNNQQQIGLGYAGLAERTQANQGQLAVQQGQLLNQNRAMNIQEQQYRDQKQTGENRDSAFKEVLTSRGVGLNGKDPWENPAEDGVIRVGDASSYSSMSGYY